MKSKTGRFLEMFGIVVCVVAIGEIGESHEWVETAWHTVIGVGCVAALAIYVKTGRI